MATPTSSDDYLLRPRFSGEITPEQQNLLQQILPHGMKKQLVQIFVNGIIELHQRGGQLALGAIVSNFISIDQLLIIGTDMSRKAKIEVLEKKLEELKSGNS